VIIITHKDVVVYVHVSEYEEKRYLKLKQR